MDILNHVRLSKPSETRNLAIVLKQGDPERLSNGTITSEQNKVEMYGRIPSKNFIGERVTWAHFGYDLHTDSYSPKLVSKLGIKQLPCNLTRLRQQLSKTNKIMLVFSARCECFNQKPRKLFLKVVSVILLKRP